MIIRERDSRSGGQNMLGSMMANLLSHAQAQNQPIDPNLLLQLVNASQGPAYPTFNQAPPPYVAYPPPVARSDEFQQPNVATMLSQLSANANILNLLKEKRP